MRSIHAKLRENKHSQDGRCAMGFGARVGYWPCLKAPFFQIEMLFWNFSLWYGLPSYKP